MPDTFHDVSASGADRRIPNRREPVSKIVNHAKHTATVDEKTPPVLTTWLVSIGCVFEMGSNTATGESMQILELRGVRKYFGGIKAVDDVSLAIKSNKVIGIIGPNGAGKTTLFNLITGFLRPDRGNIFFKGDEIKKLPPHKIVKLGICRSYQELRLFRRLRVIDNVYLGFPEQRYDSILRALFGKRFEKSKERKENLATASSLLKLSNLVHKKDILAESLSFGEQKFLMMDRILATGAELILLDEPTSGLDAGQIEGVLAMIQSLIREGKTVLAVEHNIDVIMSISDYIFVLDQGKKVAEGKPREIHENEKVLQTYLGE
jgi:ABC-type branched-subunit amino acid transport system ATPase component